MFENLCWNDWTLYLLLLLLSDGALLCIVYVLASRAEPQGQPHQGIFSGLAEKGQSVLSAPHVDHSCGCRKMASLEAVPGKLGIARTVDHF